MVEIGPFQQSPEVVRLPCKSPVASTSSASVGEPFGPIRPGVASKVRLLDAEF